MKCIIMAGGKGTRLWPISRRDKPKQFQRLISDNTMLQETFLRLREKFLSENIYVSTNVEYVSEVASQTSKYNFPQENIIGEPIFRGTASCMALAAAIIASRDENELLAFFPADHLIKNPKVLISAIAQAEEFIKSNGDYIVTFGIKPKSPETGYGYIKQGKLLKKADQFKIFQIKSFVEKPDMKTAQKYVDSGNFLWNSGIYIGQTKSIINKFKKYIPDTHERILKIKNAAGSKKYNDVLLAEYPQMDNINIEYGIIENDSNIAVIPLNLDWSDVGSWSSLKDSLEADNGKHFVKGEHIDFGSENLLVYGSKKLIATIGIKDLIIIDSEDAILVCDKHKSGIVSDVVKKLEESGKIKLL